MTVSRREFSKTLLNGGVQAGLALGAGLGVGLGRVAESLAAEGEAEYTLKVASVAPEGTTLGSSS